MVPALRNVSLTVHRGHIVSLVGPSGCGKSTVLKILAGLESYDSGLVEIAGAAPKPGRRDCGIMLQAAVLLPWRTVLENVHLPIELMGLDMAEGKSAAVDWLGTVGLADFTDKYPWELSGGMQQRASLARALVAKPEVLLMDEPFAALDEFTRERLNFEILDLHMRLRPSIVYVTHNVWEAVILSDEVVLMGAHPGEVVDVVSVDIPRPRSRDVLEDHTAAICVSKIRRTLTRVSK